jgi:hypothetical protein
MTSGRKAKTRAPQSMWSRWYWQDHVMTIANYTALETAIEHSYAAFVRGEAYTDAIRMPDDNTRLRHSDQDGIGEEDQRDTLSEAWDEWLMRHPDQRAAWDTEPRETRLRALEAQHVQLPRPFSAESIVANPAWYRRLYGIFGMTDEMFETFLHVHRFAIAQKEAQILAKDQEKETGAHGTPGQKRRSAAIYLQGYSHVPEHPIVPLDIQERACRAYCKRMGYKVHRVYRAMTPPPANVPLHLEIGIAPGRAFEYYRSESNHPFHAVHNQLDARTIDLIVEFIESGPSHSLYGASLADESSRLLRTEVASLWEIEPPTEDERRLDEVLTRLGEAETEEERAPLLEELRTVSQRVKKAERKTTSRTVTPTRAVAKEPPEKPKLCYACHVQPARDGSAFCSDACAQAAAERYVQLTTGGWCGACGTWIGSEGCPHSR